MIIIDTSHIEELAKGLEDLPVQLKQVTSLAINRTVDVMRTESWNQIKQTYNIKQHDLYQHLVKNKSTPSHLEGSLVAHAPHIPISQFNVTPGSPQPAQKPFVTFSVKKNSVSYVPESFVAIMKSGHKGLFVRDDPTRLPIRELFTIGAAEMLGAEKVRTAVEAKAVETFDKEFRRLTEIALKRALEHH